MLVDERERRGRECKVVTSISLQYAAVPLYYAILVAKVSCNPNRTLAINHKLKSMRPIASYPIRSHRTILPQRKTIPDRVPKPPDRFVNLSELGRRIRRTEEHFLGQRRLAPSRLLTRAKPAALHQQRPVLDVLVEELVFDLLQTQFRIARVLRVIDLHPVEHARGRRDPGYDVCREVLGARRENGVPARCVFHPDVDQPVQVTAVSPVVFEQLEQHQLAHPAG